MITAERLMKLPEPLRRRIIAARIRTVRRLATLELARVRISQMNDVVETAAAAAAHQA